MDKALRVAFFPDSFLEVNGVSMTSKRLIGYARKNGYPFLCVHAGKKTGVSVEDTISYLSLKRSPLSFSLDEDLAFDPFFSRHTGRILRQLVEFKPDILHITGLNDVSNIGAYLAWKMRLPLLGSWHTNLHEFAARRLSRMFRFLPDATLQKFTSFSERKIMEGSVFYYKMPQVILSPNQELVDILGKGTGRESRLMSRGVDTEKFSPEKRTLSDGTLRIGFVGRLRAEKNVRMLSDLERELIKAGKSNFKFLIVGEGNEREFLEKNMQFADFTGFLEGEQLSEAYANMDIFVFPSETDAFGNVAQEAIASGVPAIVSNQGGPKFIITHNETGYIAENFEDFVKFSLELMDNPEKLAAMKIKAREKTITSSWDAVFETVYDAYEECIKISSESKAAKEKRVEQTR